jgi:cyanophycin synthetase
VNAGPGLRMHLSPTSGEAQDVGGAIVDMLFPNGETGRIPIIAITGTNGKTTVTRVLAHTLTTKGLCVGHTTSNGIYINGLQIAEGDTTGPVSALTVLSDSRVEAAVLETARGGIMRGGLAYDYADVGIVTNIRADHIGQDGIESVEDIVHVKALVAEQVRDGGTVVLNADDEYASKLADRPAVRAGNKIICYYSLSENNPLVEKSRNEGCCSYFVRGGWIVESKGDTETRIIHISEIGFSFDGTSEYQISNALAVCAAARAVDVPIEIIRSALKTFEPATQNLGRGTLYKVGAGHLFLDYGHNPDAINAVAQTIRRWNPRRLVSVLGLPGDRADELILESAKVAALNFDRIILRDDYDRRGRAPGEVPLMALQAVEITNRRCEAAIVVDEKQAIAHVIEELRPGDVAVVFYDELESALEVLRRYDPEPVTTLPDFSELVLEERVGHDANSSFALS